MHAEKSADRRTDRRTTFRLYIVDAYQNIFVRKINALKCKAGVLTLQVAKAISGFHAN